MAKTKEQKRKIIENLREKITQQKSMVFVDFKGVKIKDLSVLRKKLKAADCRFLVVKKTLMNLIFKEKNIKIESSKIEGQVAVAFGFQDKLSPAKIVYQFSRENENLKILGGLTENQISNIKNQKYQFLDAEQIIELAQIPSREELLAKLVGTISAPISNFVDILRGNIKGLIIVLAKAKTLKI